MVEVRIGDEHLSLSWEAWEQHVAEGRIPEDALVRFAPVTGEGFERAGELGMYRSAAARGPAAFARVVGRATPPLLTAVLLGVQIRLWGWARLEDVSHVMEHDLTTWTSPVLEDGELWRLVSMGLLHTAFAHVLLNSVWFAYTGYHLERALGARNLAVLFLASVFGGSLFSLFGSPAVPSLGASGGIFGMVAACVVFGLMRPDLLPDRMRSTFGFALLPYLFLMLLSGTTAENTDNWAHFGGALTGAALAIVMDPPGMDRRPGWSARWQAAVLGLLLATCAGLFAAGPRLMPLVDDATARRADAAMRSGGRAAAMRPPDADRPLTYAVPAGWRRGRVDGRTGYRAPTAPRGWYVDRVTHDTPQSAEQVLARLVDDPSASPIPAGLDGRQTAAVRVEDTSTEPPLQREIHVLARGLESVVAIWQVPIDQQARLAPLRDRLLGSVVLRHDDTEARLTARLAERPDDRRAARGLAEHLAETGRGAEALARWDVPPLDANRTDDDWRALLRTARWYPEAAAPIGPRIAPALVPAAGPRTLAEAARLLVVTGDEATAHGLLDLAWRHRPGERRIAEVRRELDLSTALSGRVPAGAVWDPIADEPQPADAPPDVSLANASARGTELTAQRDRLARRVHAALDADHVPAAVRALYLWRDGHPPADPSAAAARAVVVARRLAPALSIDPVVLSARIEATDPARLVAWLEPVPPDDAPALP